MAPETAKRCEERCEGRGLIPRPSSSTLQLAAGSASAGYGLFARPLCRKGLKMDKHFHRLCSSYPNEKPHTISTL
ncbi:hypothetical protein DEV91_13132 [Phyllobacterium brassicacearum]|nr:hypothetical protein DEV91_13132 [Phyllobacterium brassicacearum]